LRRIGTRSALEALRHALYNVPLTYLLTRGK